MTIVFQSPIKQPDVLQLPPLASQIKALPGFVDWLSCDETRATVSATGGVETLKTLNNVSLNWSPAAGARPTFIKNALRRNSVVAFNKASILQAPSPIIDLSQPFTAAIIFKPIIDPGQFLGYLAWFHDAGDHLLLSQNGSQNALRWGTHVDGIEFIAYVDSLYHCAFLYYGGTSLKSRIDGGEIKQKTITAATLTGSLAVGGLSAASNAWRAGMQLADVVLCQSDLLASEDLQRPIMDYAKYVYGVNA